MDNIEKGSNPHGFKNEELIVTALNDKRFGELQGSLAKFVKRICEDNEIEISTGTVVKAMIERNNKLKQDFYIVIEGKKFGISVKMGQSNSVHQEKIDGFIEWLTRVSTLEVTDEVKDNFRFFIWADGSIDGKSPVVIGADGKINGRFGCKEFKKLYPDKRENLQLFLEKNAEIILNRAIFEGKNNSKVDYVYHGTPLNGVWLSKQEIIDFNIQKSKVKDIKNSAVLSVGRLTVQPWNSDLTGNNAKKRGEIQFKYSAMTKDFEDLMFIKANNIGTFEGDQEEFNISKIMNRNKNHRFWNVISDLCTLDLDKDNYYVVKVEENKESQLSGKKVKCKTDNFIIQANISKAQLLQCEYQITEKMLQNIGKYKVISNSGISVKKADSKKYTIVKLTHNTFEQAFAEYIEGVNFIIAGLLLYSDKKKIHINTKMLEDLKIQQSRLINFYIDTYDLSGNGILDSDFIVKISRKAREVVKETIENQPELKDKLFTGKGWFDDPFCINFIFKEGKLTSDIYTDYTVSNGSGRSKGNYSIILKPQ